MLPKRKTCLLARVTQTNEMISAASKPKFTILWAHVEEILLLNKFFPIVDTCLNCEDIARQSCATVPRWRFFGEFLRPVFSASHKHHVTDLHLKFALRPPKYVEVRQASNLRWLRLGEEKKDRKIERKKRKKKSQGKNIMSASVTHGGHN